VRFREDGKLQMHKTGKLEAYPTSIHAIISAASEVSGLNCRVF
jgi:hypothetical protein